MQPQIPTPAKFFFIILTHPHLGGVISPSRALRDPTTAPKQPDIPPKMTHFPYHVLKRYRKQMLIRLLCVLSDYAQQCLFEVIYYILSWQISFGSIMGTKKPSLGPPKN